MISVTQSCFFLLSVTGCTDVKQCSTPHTMSFGVGGGRRGATPELIWRPEPGHRHTQRCGGAVVLCTNEGRGRGLGMCQWGGGPEAHSHTFCCLAFLFFSLATKFTPPFISRCNQLCCWQTHTGGNCAQENGESRATNRRRSEDAA